MFLYFYLLLFDLFNDFFNFWHSRDGIKLFFGCTYYLDIIFFLLFQGGSCLRILKATITHTINIYNLRRIIILYR